MTKFGIKQLKNDTPEWAKWIFRSWFFISKALLGWLSYTKLIESNTLHELIGVFSLLIDPIMFGFSKMFGIVPNKDNDEK